MQELAAVKRILGRGEIAVTINAHELVNVTETSLAGVWCISKCSLNRQIASNVIKVADIPALLIEDDNNIRKGLDGLRLVLSQVQERNPR